jgi:hypothetical protein
MRCIIIALERAWGTEYESNKILETERAFESDSV